ncbi:hypothetical protein GCM10010399_09310 [Dactylosporangium fulvum]
MSTQGSGWKNVLVPVEDLRPLFTARSAAKVHPALAMRSIDRKPGLTLDSDTIGLLHDGLGFYDMEIRWVVHLDAADVLRLWRSWTGYQIYEARVVLDAPGARATIEGLKVEQHPDRFTSLLFNEPALFERVLISTVNHLRRFRAGHTPYGPSPSAGPAPEPWPAIETEVAE